MKTMPALPKSLVLLRSVDGQRCYPPTLASHDEVVKDPALFFNTLHHFHLSLGTKYMNARPPVVSGKQLNLHVLYVEVTGRGGYDKVIMDKKWREVGAIFSFSPTTTSASYVLRRHYKGYLHPYEQAYFLRLQGPLRTPLPAFAMPITPNHVSGISNDPKRDSSGKTTSSPSYEVAGVINGKVEDGGYMVSVKYGTEQLRGVLYHVDQHSSSPSIVHPRSTALKPLLIPKNPFLLGRRKRRAGDPTQPKPNRSGYNFFFAEKHAEFKARYPNREKEYIKMIGESWGSLSKEQKMVYQAIGMEDKERYRQELKEYKKKLMLKELVPEANHADNIAAGVTGTDNNL